MRFNISADLSHDLIPAGYEVRPEGVFFMGGPDPRRLTTTAAWVHSATRTLESSAWSMVIAWRDHDENIRSAVIPYAQLGSRGGAELEQLAASGLLVIPGCQQKFAEFLALSTAVPQLPRVRTHRQLGFFPIPHGNAKKLAFMLPSGALVSSAGDEVEPVCFQPVKESPAFELIAGAGSLEAWQSMVAEIEGNSLLVFALCVAFASPLVDIGGMETAIFHLFGSSSTGKTTALQLAASVWGRAVDPQIAGSSGTIVERWNATQNAIEPLAATYSGTLLTIDELGSSGEAALSIYNFTSGKGKLRMSETGELRGQHQWALCVLSSGECSLQDKIELTSKRKAKTGELIRGLDLPVGEVEQQQVLAQDEQRMLVERLKLGCGETYGTAGPAFVQAVMDSLTADELVEMLAESVESVHQGLVAFAKMQTSLLGAAHIRALRRFAFVQVAGLWAVQAQVLPFAEDSVEAAVRAVVKAWLGRLPALSEGASALDVIRAYVIRHSAQILDYESWRATGADTARLPRDLRAIRKKNRLLFTEEQFLQACGGFSMNEALKHLRDQQLLEREAEKLTLRVDIAEMGIKRIPFYAIDVRRLLGGSNLSLVHETAALRTTSMAGATSEPPTRRTLDKELLDLQRL